MENDWIRQWLTLWQAKDPSAHALSAVAGLIGSGVYSAVASPKVVLWKWDRKARTLHLGFLSNVIIGVTASVVVDIAFPVGVMAAFLAPTILDLVQKRVLPGLASIVLLWAEKRAGAKREEGIDG